MNKLLPFALALALALPGCAAGDTAPQPPETPTTTTETAAEAPAKSTLPGLAGRLRQTSYDTAVGQTFYGMMSTYDEETLTSVYTIIQPTPRPTPSRKRPSWRPRVTIPVWPPGRTAWNCTLTIGWMRPASP